MHRPRKLIVTIRRNENDRYEAVVTRQKETGIVLEVCEGDRTKMIEKLKDRLMTMADSIAPSSKLG